MEVSKTYLGGHVVSRVNPFNHGKRTRQVRDSRLSDDYNERDALSGRPSEVSGHESRRTCRERLEQEVEILAAVLLRLQHCT